MNITTVISHAYTQNCFIVSVPGRDDCLVIDPGLDAQKILHSLREQNLTPAVILNTHGHLDHIAGNAPIKAAFPAAPLIIGTGDAFMLTDPNGNLSAFLGSPVISPKADALVNEGDKVNAAGIELEVREIPGHSPGHVVFIVRTSPIQVFGGDVLFRESIGRTDFPGGSLEQLLTGIRKKLYDLPDDTIIYPGHGPTTTIGYEKENNPFVL